MQLISAVFRLIRYRFFLFAGIFPYLLGQVVAFNVKKALDLNIFLWGFFGIFLCLAGVELFNEYFDSKEGGDRIFSQESENIPDWFFGLGIFVFAAAFFIAIYLTFRAGWPILLFSILGFFGAYYYVGPPIRWAYRGMGEAVIAFSYGPFMLLGSYYLQAREINIAPFMVSLICGLTLFSLAIFNEIPDYIQDRLVGKKNIVVRLGKEKALKVALSGLFSAFVLLSIGIWWKKIPYFSIAGFVTVPLVLNIKRITGKGLDDPVSFIPAIRMTIITYVIVMCSLGISYIAV